MAMITSRNAVFYLLCFLICIDWSFCYECINSVKAMRPDQTIKKNAKSKHERQKNHHRRVRRQEYEEEKDPVANIDVASFIQQPDPDYEAIEDPRQYKSRRRASRYYDDLESINDLEISLRNRNQNLKEDLDELESSNILYGQKLSNSGKLVNNEFSADIVHNNLSPKSKESMKSSRRRQVIPFFSHESKEKKHKKRKFFSFGKEKTTTTTMSTLLPKFDGSKPDSKNQFIKVKRSNVDSFCPVCYRKMKPKSKKEKQKAPRKNIHNSRQYFQNISEIGQTKQKKAVSNNAFRINRLIEREKRDTDEDEEEYDIKQSGHSKRYDFSSERDKNFKDKEQQLKELDDIQRKLDALDIKFPQHPNEVTQTTIHIY